MTTLMERLCVHQKVGGQFAISIGGLCKSNLGGDGRHRRAVRKVRDLPFPVN